MADTPAAQEITINVKGGYLCILQTHKFDTVPGPSELKLQITIATDKTVADLKSAIAEKSDVPADRQRLIYSGASLLSVASVSQADERAHPQDVY